MLLLNYPANSFAKFVPGFRYGELSEISSTTVTCLDTFQSQSLSL